MSERSLAKDLSAVYRAFNRKVSVSTVTMYQYCPVAAYLRYVEHHIPQPTLKIILGRVIHAAATAFYEDEKQLISSVDKHSTKETIAQQGINIIRKAAIQAAKTQKVAALDYARKTRPSLFCKVELDRTSIAKQGNIASLFYLSLG